MPVVSIHSIRGSSPKGLNLLLAISLSDSFVSGLSNNPEGKRKVTVGVDDELLKTSSRQISRGDVAEVCIQSLLAPKASKRYIPCTFSV